MLSAAIKEGLYDCNTGLHAHFMHHKCNSCDILEFCVYILKAKEANFDRARINTAALSDSV